MRQKLLEKLYKLGTNHQKERRVKSPNPPRMPLDGILKVVYNIEKGVSKIIDNIEVLGEKLGKQKYGEDLKASLKEHFT